jgi:endonuclease/exonuclease/phosphatase (EEP) superfamily protein YafD
LTGDLNDVPGSEPINILESKWSKYYDSDDYEITFPGTGQKLDYVMGYPKSRLRMLEQQVIKDKIASDHYALLVVLEIMD